jgi:hypothetical protein
MPVAFTAGTYDHVDVGVNAAVLRIRIPDLEHPGRTCRFVNQMMSIFHATAERCAVPRSQQLFATAGHEREFTFQDPDEFIFVAVPVTLA